MYTYIIYIYIYTIYNIQYITICTTIYDHEPAVFALWHPRYHGSHGEVADHFDGLQRQLPRGLHDDGAWLLALGEEASKLGG